MILMGPEASISFAGKLQNGGILLQDRYRKARLGAHISEIPIFAHRLGIAGGFERFDEGSRGQTSGAYGAISLYTRF